MMNMFKIGDTVEIKNRQMLYELVAYEGNLAVLKNPDGNIIKCTKDKIRKPLLNG